MSFNHMLAPSWFLHSSEGVTLTYDPVLGNDTPWILRIDDRSVLWLSDECYEHLRAIMTAERQS